VPDGSKERRKNARAPANGEVAGRIHAIKSAPILNISERGALIEAPSVLRPGSLYTLQVGVDHPRPLTLKARVVRSYVHKVVAQAGGEGVVRYRAALAFEDLNEETLAALRRHVQTLQGSEEEF
jgi:PilZ domain